MVMILNKNFGQEVRGQERSGSQNVICESSSSYGFLVDGVYFTSGKNVSICGDKFPVHIVAVTSNKVHVNDPEMVWVQANGTYSPSNGQAEDFIYLDYLSSEGKLKLQYSLPNNQGASITIHQLHKVEIKKSETTKYAFDDNKIPEYPYYDDGKPYKFLAAGKSDNVVMDVNVLAPASYPLTLFRDQKLNYSKKSNILTLSQRNAANTDSIYMMACDTIDVMKVDIYPEKTLDVNIYTLAETDDDIANYCIDKNRINGPYEAGDVDGSLMPDCKTPISSPNHECILPGPDGSLDLFNKVNPFWIDKDNDKSKPRDSILLPSNQTNLLKIYAGTDLFCNERPLKHDTSAYPIIKEETLNQIKLNLDSIYSQCGISFKIHFKGVRYTNFDSKIDDNTINDPIEQFYIHNQLFGGDVKDFVRVQTTSVIFVDSMTGVYGRATGNQMLDSVTQEHSNMANTVMINNKIFNKRTIAHEIGHGKYYLFHCDDSSGIEFNGLKNVNFDKKNFMISGYNSDLNIPLKDYMVRKYQWKLIHKYH
jgi:hypothetical protein